MAYQECVDANGVKYELRELTPVDTLDIIEAAEDASGNSSWVQYAMMMCAVERIDDVPVPMPTTKQQIRALAAKIGNAGVVAIQRTMFPSVKKIEDKPGEKSLTKTEEVAKN